MYYRSVNDLPSVVRHVLPRGAQKIYLRAFNYLWRQTLPDIGPRKQRTHVYAWRAMQLFYAQNTYGKWVRRNDQWPQLYY